MQTTFTLAQLADPHVAESEKILRACVHCGFCTATCPTYVLLGDELDSPARAHLSDQGHAGERPAGDRGGGQAHRPLPVLPRLHDDLPVGRALHAPRRSCPRPYRGDLPAAAGRPRCCAPCWPSVLPYPQRFRLALHGWRWLAKPLAPLAGGDRAQAARRHAAAGAGAAAAPCRSAAASLPGRRDAEAGAWRCCPAASTPVLGAGDQRRRDRCSPATASRSCCAQGAGLLRLARPPHGPRGRGARPGARAISTPGRARSTTAGSTPS